MPFTPEQFLETFRRYNKAIWPVQILLVAIAVVVAATAVRARCTARFAGLMLAVLWGWSGVVYHAVFFRDINPVAPIFGVFFVLEGALLVFWSGRSGARVAFTRSTAGWMGAALIAYALLFYPILGSLSSHGYPDGPTFGVPCPLTVFTFGLLLWSDKPVPWSISIIPLGWSILGLSAAMSLGIREDLALPMAALAFVVVRSTGHRIHPRHV